MCGPARGLNVEHPPLRHTTPCRAALQVLSGASVDSLREPWPPAAPPGFGSDPEVQAASAQKLMAKLLAQPAVGAAATSA